MVVVVGGGGGGGSGGGGWLLAVGDDGPRAATQRPEAGVGGWVGQATTSKRCEDSIDDILFINLSMPGSFGFRRLRPTSTLV